MGVNGRGLMANPFGDSSELHPTRPVSGRAVAVAIARRQWASNETAVAQAPPRCEAQS